MEEESKKTDVKSEDDNETKEDKKTLTQSVETKESGVESTHRENPKEESQGAKVEEKETGLEENLTSKDVETPMQIDDVEPKSLSEVHDDKPSVDKGCADSKPVGDTDDKTKSDESCGTIKQAERPETKVAPSLDTTKDDSEGASVSAQDIEKKETKEADDDPNKIPDENRSGKEVGEDLKDSPVEISNSETQRDKKASDEKDPETSEDKKGEETAPEKNDGKESDKNVSTDEDTINKGVGNISKDTGETAKCESEPMEIEETKEAGDTIKVADNKDNVSVKEKEKTAADNTESTEHTKEDIKEAGDEPDKEPEEPAVPKMSNGVALKGTGRRKGNPKRTVPVDDTPEPSTSAAETKATRAQPAKKESSQPPSKKPRGIPQRTQPPRRSKRRKSYGWGAKRKTRTRRNQ